MAFKAIPAIILTALLAIVLQTQTTSALKPTTKPMPKPTKTNPAMKKTPPRPPPRRRRVHRCMTSKNCRGNDVCMRNMCKTPTYRACGCRARCARCTRDVHCKSLHCQYGRCGIYSKADYYRCLPRNRPSCAACLRNVECSARRCHRGRCFRRKQSTPCSRRRGQKTCQGCRFGRECRSRFCRHGVCMNGWHQLRYCAHKTRQKSFRIPRFAKDLLDESEEEDPVHAFHEQDDDDELTDKAEAFDTDDEEGGHDENDIQESTHIESESIDQSKTDTTDRETTNETDEDIEVVDLTVQGTSCVKRDGKDTTDYIADEQADETDETNETDETDETNETNATNATDETDETDETDREANDTSGEDGLGDIGEEISQHATSDDIEVTEHEDVDDEFEDEDVDNNGMAAGDLAQEDEHMLHENEDEEDDHDDEEPDDEDWLHEDISDRFEDGLEDGEEDDDEENEESDIEEMDRMHDDEDNDDSIEAMEGEWYEDENQLDGYTVSGLTDKQSIVDGGSSEDLEARGDAGVSAGVSAKSALTADTPASDIHGDGVGGKLDDVQDDPLLKEAMADALNN